MSNIHECLQPAVEQLTKYETQISALESKNRSLEDDIQVLQDEKSRLNEQIAEDKEAHKLAVETFEKEKMTLRELNVVVSDQLREKSNEIEALTETNARLSEQNSRVSSESIRVNAGQEALSHQSQRLNDELEKLRSENESLRDKLLNKGEPTGAATGDSAYLESENKRLMQRHGEITQEKMQASAKMHAAQKDLEETISKLDTTQKSLEELEFEYQGLQNLHKNLIEERDALFDDNKDLLERNVELDERVLRLSERIQLVTTEKELLEQELAKEHVIEDGLADEVNHLRMKSRRLAEENKELREGHHDETETGVAVLEIDSSNDLQADEIEIVAPSSSTGSHFPGEGFSDDTEHKSQQ
ncbi:hypothetical protein ACFLR3_04960 [Campylobacterota bacterium]